MEKTKRMILEGMDIKEIRQIRKELLESPNSNDFIVEIDEILIKKSGEKYNKILDGEELATLNYNIMNRFNILTFIDENGEDWAISAIDPTNELNWTHDAYLKCYNNPEA